MTEFDVQKCPIPSSSDEFIRTWKRQCTTPDSKFTLLKHCGRLQLQSIFRVTLPGTLLSEILIVLNSLTPTAAKALQTEQLAQLHDANQDSFAEANAGRLQDVDRHAQTALDILQGLSGTATQVQALCQNVYCELTVSLAYGRDRKIPTHSEIVELYSQESS